MDETIYKLIKLRIRFVFFACIIGIFFSCVSETQQRIDTSYKLATYLNEGEAEKIRELIALDADKIGKHPEAIQQECKQFQYLVNKYGFPDSSSYVYKEDTNNFLLPISIEIPIFEGQDTLWNWRLRSAKLVIHFGPSSVNRPDRIADYELAFNKDILNY